MTETLPGVSPSMMLQDSTVASDPELPRHGSWRLLPVTAAWR
jgi:hypothetical protein